MQVSTLRLILASASPRRIALIGQLGLAFEAIPSQIDEIADPDMPPDELVVRLATDKARAVVEKIDLAGPVEDVLVMGFDTTVVLRGRVLGKPASAEEAADMLKAMSGRSHFVYTGVALLKCPEGAVSTAWQRSYVCFRTLAIEEINAYVATGEPMDKAGSYALQGAASAFVERIEGCYTNVIGLPVPLLVTMLRSYGISVLGCP